MYLTYRKLWPSIVVWTEEIARGTDYIRVDYFVNTIEETCIAIDMNIFPWPESTFYRGFEDILINLFVKVEIF